MEQGRGLAHPTNGHGNSDRKGEHLEIRRNSLAFRLRHGNRAAASELVDIYYRQIYLFMRRLGHGQQASEDLAQESFLQAWMHIGQLRNDDALNSWLYRIAGNVSRLYWRRHKGKEPVSIEFDLPDERETGNSAGEYEELERLKTAVARLPGKLKEAVVLHYMQHLSISEAAAAAGIREGTFKSRLNRALETLRKRIT